MMYEYTIVCLVCGQLVSQGGSITLLDLDRGQILSQAHHHPGCALLQLRDEQADELVLEQERTAYEHATVTQYMIAR